MTVERWLVREPDEEVLWAGRPRVTPTLSRALGTVVTLVALAWVVFGGNGWILALVVLVSLLPAVWSTLRVARTRFVVTDRACYRRTGVLSLHVQRVGLRRIQDTSLRRGITGSLFGYGTIRINVAGGWGIGFTSIDGPEEVRSLLNQRLDDTDTLPGTLEQWEAIRDELRTLRSAVERYPPKASRTDL